MSGKDNGNTTTMHSKDTITCTHCKGTGECYCILCAASPDRPADCRDEIDTARQEERTCKFCLGLGRLNTDGTPLLDENEF